MFAPLEVGKRSARIDKSIAAADRFIGNDVVLRIGNRKGHAGDSRLSRRGSCVRTAVGRRKPRRDRIGIEFHADTALFIDDLSVVYPADAAQIEHRLIDLP